MIATNQDFRLPRNWDVDYGLVLLFRARQQRLINYDYHGPAWRDAPYIPPCEHSLANVTCLQLYLRQPKDCEHAGVLINRASRVTSLAIEVDKDLRRACIRNPVSSRLQRLEVIRQLFGSTDVNAPRSLLRFLRIKSFSLGEMAEVLPTKLPLQGLRHLELIACPSERTFVGKLVQLQVNLETYYVRACAEQGLRAPNEHESLVRLMTSPRRLVVNSTTRISHDWATLFTSSHTLKALRIVDEEYDIDNMCPVFHRSMDGFFDFCGAASGLEQLAMTCPAVEISRWEEPEGFLRMLVGVYRLL